MSSHSTVRRRTAWTIGAAAIIAAGAGLAGCQRERAASADEAKSAPAALTAAPGERAAKDMPPASPPSPESSLQAAGVATAGDYAAPADAASAVQTSGQAASAMIIRTANATIQVDSLETGIAAIRQLARRLGGYVANSATQTGQDQLRSSTLELKIPSARFDEAMTALTPLGKVEAVNVSSEDVGEEYVDVSARTANTRRLETRLVELLATRTGKLSDVLEIERELARVREQIERFDGRLRYLRARTALSTLAITIHEPAPIVASRPGTHPIRDAFGLAWRNFVGLVAVAIASSGVLIPLGAVVALALLAWRRFRSTASAQVRGNEPASVG
jgi:uncharacterized protein DUF4349